tara:strand:+ start:213 stop:584 length:372 start_codon:yes stop_codon:yes gene_type:complete
MANKKTYWTNKEIDTFKKMINEKKAKTKKDMKENKKRADEMMKSNTTNALYSSHMADASADHTEMERAYYFIAREKKFLTYLDRALEMINNRTFGKCVMCGNLISKERLEEVPHTTKCIFCSI